MLFRVLTFEVSVLSLNKYLPNATQSLDSSGLGEGVTSGLGEGVVLGVEKLKHQLSFCQHN